MRLPFIVLIFVLINALSPAPALGQETPLPDWRFGVVEAYEAPQQADALGAAWTRVTLNWAELQGGGPDTWTPPVDEARIQEEAARGRLVVGLLIGAPDWVRDSNGLPAGLHADPASSDNLWAGFVRRAVAQYGDTIDHWVVWNEPDIWDEEAPGHTWPGSVEDFARLLQVTYQVAKESDAQAVIHLPALTYYWDANYGRVQYLDRLLTILAADAQAEAHNAYFDVATAHLYFQPHAVYEVIGAFQDILAAHGLHKPIWLVETNAPPSNDPTWPVADVTLSVTMDEQAAYVPQAMAAALAAGAERLAIYKLQDVPGDRQANPEPFGLIRMDGSRRRAFSTYQTAIRFLAGVHSAERERWDGIGQVRLEQGAFTTTVLFSRLPTAQEATVPATAETALLVDMWGNRQVIRAEAGHFSVPLPPALCTQSIGDYCMIGGTTYYLVQATEGGAVPDAWPVLAQSPTATPRPTVTPQPMATAQPTAALTPAPTAANSPTPTSGAPQAVELQPPLNEAVVDFPNSVTFRLQLPPGLRVQTATLNYDVERRDCAEASSAVPVAPEGDLLEWTWVMSRSGNPPPGARVWWEWTVLDEDGQRWRTPRQTLTLEDDRFEWRTVSGEQIDLHWYEGDDVGPLLLDAAQSGLQRLEEDMGIILQDDVSFYIYGNPADMRQAVLYVQDWAGGVAFSVYNTILIGVSPAQAEGWGRETVRHELAHLVLGQFGWSCLGGSRPTWLEEGLATYAQGPADEETQADIRRGIEEDAFLPLRSLNGAFPAHDSAASLAYSQSYSVVAFLLEAYGVEQLQTLIQVLAQGLSYDESLEQVYGMNVDGLEVAWREAIGAPPRDIPPTPTPLSAAAIPTVPPFTAPELQPTPAEAAEAPSGGLALPICGLGWAPLLLVGAFLLVTGDGRKRRA